MIVMTIYLLLTPLYFIIYLINLANGKISLTKVYSSSYLKYNKLRKVDILIWNIKI